VQRALATDAMTTPAAFPSTPSQKGGKPPGFDLLAHNRDMAGAIESFLAPTYGPGGRAKLFLDAKGNAIPATDGARMLSTLDSPHPVGKILRSIATAQEEEWADGTKLAALLAVRLLHRSGPLLDQGVRPARIVRGFEIGLDWAIGSAEASAVALDPFEGALLLDVARGCLGGWLDPRPREELAKAVVQAATRIASKTPQGWRCSRRDIHVFAKAAGAFSVRVIDGYVLDRWRDDPNMPPRVEDARIALLDAEPIRGKAGVHEPRLRWYGESKVRLQSPAQLEGYSAVGEDYTRRIVERLQAAGANVVVTTLGMSDYGHKLLAKAGILGIRAVMRPEYMRDLARATGAGLIKDFQEIRTDQLGHAGLVEEIRLGGSKCTIIDRCPDPQVVSLLVLGPGQAAAELYKTLARKAIGAAAASIEMPRFLAGGAGAEMAASSRVRRDASRVEGREQLAVEAFGLALEDLAACLAANLGLKPLDAVLALRTAHAKSADWGILAGQREPVDYEHGLFREPLGPRLSAWRRGVEAASTILLADDFHKVSRPSLRKKASDGEGDKDR